MERKVYNRHIKNQKTHWWFNVRRKLISEFIKENSTNKKKNLKILDYGCGSGTNIEALAKFGKVFCYEKDKKTTNYLLSKYKKDQKVKVFKKLDKSIKYDYIILADVLEHIKKKDENKFIKNCVKSLKKNGVMITGMPSLESQKFASPASKKGHVNCKSGNDFKKIFEKYFHNVFLFSMNDEVIHTGFNKMSHYLMLLCANKK